MLPNTTKISVFVFILLFAWRLPDAGAEAKALDVRPLHPAFERDGVTLQLFSDLPDPTKVATPDRKPSIVTSDHLADSFYAATTTALIEAATAHLALHSDRHKLVIARDATPLYWAMVMIAQTIDKPELLKSIQHVNLSTEIMKNDPQLLRRYLAQHNLTTDRLSKGESYVAIDSGFKGSIVHGKSVHIPDPMGSGGKVYSLRDLFPEYRDQIDIHLLESRASSVVASTPMVQAIASTSSCTMSSPVEEFENRSPHWHEKAIGFVETITKPSRLIPAAIAPQPSFENRKSDPKSAKHLLDSIAYQVRTENGCSVTSARFEMWQRIKNVVKETPVKQITPNVLAPHLKSTGFSGLQSHLQHAVAQTARIYSHFFVRR